MTTIEKLLLAFAACFLIYGAATVLPVVMNLSNTIATALDVKVDR